MSQDEDMPTPSLDPAFELELDHGAEWGIGDLATGGQRWVRQLASGRLSGRGLAAGLETGTETWLSRRDGVSVVEMALVIQTAHGGPIRMTGTGVSGLNRLGALRMNVVFEVAEGSPHDWLATRVFIAERRDGETHLSIFEVL
ncbi:MULTISPECIES: DUF3237 family protein [unclassified Novosphingobium]|uniref:DUF3237 family protein n=1 Tax=unclassified Novosphingobium TaxID=2644732 RepID=UPI0008692C45|nr:MULTISPECIES: DUF3237 family protein [unclassified Novosphingobium]MDR6707348.1 hypothetical protein [Novosphingobium sp. 1748]ODU83305.1 MAG: hypothetical protein ABT10_06725 [Novosphingobium sp. SCN 63-17]OJX96426.1 MAG: hypothetical protein BGP00_17900 [Novosphingobium sp. 63-713]